MRRSISLRFALSVALALATGSCATAPSAPTRSLPLGDPGLRQLVTYMSGSFSSQEQAARDAEFRDIRLHMVRIWRDRSDACWLYVEQAAASTLDRPYRQRVYRVTKLAADLYESRVYELPEPSRLAGAWQQPDRLAGIVEAELEDRQGCAILLRAQPDGTFAGSTLGRLCASSHRGSTYATSEVTVSRERLVSWDRGWDAAGKQVWGAETGGYVFSKLESYPLE